MALDGVFLRHIKTEIEATLDGARIDKIHQPSQDQLVISFRQKGGAKKLLMSVSANMPRIHFTENIGENPKSPPMFCMLLRKYLLGAKLVCCEQYELDRIMSLVFETRNELGDLVQIKLIIEIMGRHSNIILVGNDGKIIDSIKRIDPSMSSVRQVLSGMRYELPPLQDKLNILTCSVEDIIERILGGGDYPLSKALMNNIGGISPLIAREISSVATNSMDTTANYLSETELDILKSALGKLKKTAINSSGTPTIVYDENNIPCEFSFMNISVFGDKTTNKTLPSFSSVLDNYFFEKDTICKMRAKGSDLIRLVTSLTERTKRKIETQKNELEETRNRDIYRIYGDILNANLYALKKGDNNAQLVNFYSPEGEIIDIKLNPRLT
ncbi:MAG: NFACT family protein, partial [Oscillospiraceae bacterium]